MTTIQDEGRALLKMRAEQLLKLLKLNAPDVILARAATGVFKAGCLIDVAAGMALAESQREKYAFENQICFSCFDEPAPAFNVCAKCAADLGDEEPEEASLMECDHCGNLVPSTDLLPVPADAVCLVNNCCTACRTAMGWTDEKLAVAMRTLRLRLGGKTEPEVRLPAVETGDRE